MKTILAFFAMTATASAFTFDNIDGGVHDTDQWQGQPVLVVNTASMCAFTGQYEGLQKTYDTYRDAGLVVLAVPSDDFNQELAGNGEVKEFCEMTYGLDLPMSEIAHVKGAQAHPFYAWVKDQSGFVPSWNFNKVLLSPSGEIAATYGSSDRPDGTKITKAIEALLDQPEG